MADIILLRDFQASQIEFWMPTPYPGYDVSSFGRVRSLRKSGDWLILTSWDNAKGYQSINVRGSRSLHKLVAVAFVPNPHKLPEVNHLNAIGHDCRAPNLEWVSHQQNMDHAVSNGLLRPVVGEAHGRAILTVGDIRQIRALRQAGRSVRSISVQFGTCWSNVAQILAGKTWQHVQ